MILFSLQCFFKQFFSAFVPLLFLTPEVDPDPGTKGQYIRILGCQSFGLGGIFFRFFFVFQVGVSDAHARIGRGKFLI